MLPVLYVSNARFSQLAINAEQRLEIDRLRRELDLTRAELARANSALQSKEMVQMVSSNFYYNVNESFWDKVLDINALTHALLLRVVPTWAAQ